MVFRQQGIQHNPACGDGSPAGMVSQASRSRTLVSYVCSPQENADTFHTKDSVEQIKLAQGNTCSHKRGDLYQMIWKTELLG